MLYDMVEDKFPFERHAIYKNGVSRPEIKDAIEGQRCTRIRTYRRDRQFCSDVMKFCYDIWDEVLTYYGICSANGTQCDTTHAKRNDWKKVLSAMKQQRLIQKLDQFVQAHPLFLSSKRARPASPRSDETPPPRGRRQRRTRSRAPRARTPS